MLYIYTYVNNKNSNSNSTYRFLGILFTVKSSKLQIAEIRETGEIFISSLLHNRTKVSHFPKLKHLPTFQPTHPTCTSTPIEHTQRGGRIG